jgi:hypothetical protein
MPNEKKRRARLFMLQQHQQSQGGPRSNEGSARTLTDTIDIRSTSDDILWPV